MRTVLVMVIAGALVLAGCGGRDQRTTPPTTRPLPSAWSAQGVRRLEARVAAVGRALGVRCDVQKVRPAALARSRDRFGWVVVPEALGGCDTSADVVEVGIFNSVRDRDQFIDERTTSLCRAAAAGGVTVPPFAWVAGGRWSAQSDRPAEARRLAKRLGATVDVRRCDLQDTLGWSPSATKTVRRLGSVMVQDGCAAPALLDRAQKFGGVDDADLPAAAATCQYLSDSAPGTGPSGAPPQALGAVIAAFNRASQSRPEFIRAYLPPTGCDAATAAVAGGNWVVLVPEARAVALAPKLGGQVVARCRPPS